MGGGRGPAAGEGWWEQEKFFLFCFSGHGFWVNIVKIQRYVVKIQVEKIRVFRVKKFGFKMVV